MNFKVAFCLTTALAAGVFAGQAYAAPHDPWGVPRHPGCGSVGAGTAGYQNGA